MSLPIESKNWSDTMPIKIDYELMFYQAQLEKIDETENIVYEIKNNQIRYLKVEQFTKIPWYVVAAIHSLECGLNFSCHLYNGDPLTARTIHIPAGRPVAMPKSGFFPYTWEESAIDDFNNGDIWKPSNVGNWDITETLEFIERYNGLGYAMRGINTPYLWSGTSLYTSGLFVSDDEFNPNSISKEIGAVALIKVMLLKGYIQNIQGDLL